MKGRVAIITASATGIGQGIASRLAKEGATVIISSRNAEHINHVVKIVKDKGHEAHGIVCDVSRSDHLDNLVKETVQRYGRIDYLVLNAAVANGTGKPNSFLEATEEDMQAIWNVNYKSTFLLVQKALPHLKKQNGSGIVMIGSIEGYDLSPYVGQYGVTKLALVGLTKILAKELQKHGIRVNNVAPGFVPTLLNYDIRKNIPDKVILKRMGIERPGTVEDMGNAVTFLLSDQASYITGETLAVAGKPIARL